MKNIFQLFLLLILTTPIYSQIKNIGDIPFINNYSSETFKAGRQNYCGVQDQRGLLYFANSDGSVLEFDGQNWNKIRVSDVGAVTSLCVDNDNTIYVGGKNMIGYLKPTKNGSLVFQSIKQKIPKQYTDFREIWDIFITEDSTIFFQTFDMIFLYKNDSITVLPIENYFADGLFLMSYQINKKIYTYVKYKGLYILENNDLKFIEKSKIINNSFSRGIVDYKQDSLIIFTWFDGAFTMKDGKIKKKTTPIDNIITNNLYKVISFKNKYYGFQLYSGGLLITDKDFNIIQLINSNNGLEDGRINSAFFDNQENLWLSKENGIASIYLFSPFSSFTRNYGFDNESTSFSSKLYNNVLHIATSSGVYYKKWVNFEDKTNHKVFQQIENESGNIKTNFLNVIDNKLTAASDGGLYEIDNYKANYSLNLENKKAVRGIKIFRIPQEDPNTLIGLADVIYVFKKINDKWVLSHDVQDIGGSYLEQDKNGFFWISDVTLGVYKVKFDANFDNITTTSFDTINGLFGLPNQTNNKVFKIDDEVIFSTNNGLYKYDETNNNFYPYEELNSIIGDSAIIDYISKDTHGNIWYKEKCETKNQTSWELNLLKNTDSGYVKINKPFRPFISKIFSFDQISDSEYIIGGTNGFIHYDTKITNNYDIKFPAFIRSVKILTKNSIIFNGSFVSKDSSIAFTQDPDDILTIPHKYGDLRFTFSGNYYQSPDKIEYKYFLEGNDKKWSEWTTENYKDYSNLKQGEYKFQVKARNIYLIESTTASYEFIIQPPWNQTILAYICYFILGGLLIWLIVYWYTRRLRLQKEYLEDQVKQRTKEIEQQNDEIKSQRDKLADQNEEIQKINKDITSSIEYAKRIQTAMLPLDSNIQTHLKNYFILFKPRDIVSGDFYWFAHKNEKTFIAAVDCTGHGVPGAFMSMIGAEILTSIVTNEKISDAAEILKRLNKYVRNALKQDTSENQDGMDMALCVIDEKNKTVEFSGAKNPLFIIDSKGEFSKIKGSRQSIGGYQFGEFEKHKIEYTSPSWFYIFSDGYADQFGGKDQSKFMIKQFKDLLLKNHKKTMEEQQKILDNAINNWMISTRQTDDILVIGFKL